MAAVRVEVAGLVAARKGAAPRGEQPHIPRRRPTAIVPPGDGVLVFYVELPSKISSPNYHGDPSRMGRYRESLTYKTEVLVKAREAMQRRRWTAPERARVSLLFGLSTGYADRSRYYRPNDSDNAVAAFKAGFDGLTEAGVIKDDRWAHMVLGEVEATRQDGPWVRITVEALE